MNVQEFLVWLTTSAGYSAAFSFVAERVPAFQKLSSQAKSIATFIGPLAIALSAYAILTYVPPETLEAVKPIFLLVSGVLGSWVANQLAHGADPAAKPMADKPSPFLKGGEVHNRTNEPLR
jgi:hypothetical protein